MNTSNINSVPFDLTSLNPIINDFISTYKSTLENKGKRASGKLIDTIKHKIKVDGKYILVILNLEEYYRWVELGRKPGKYPPPDAIKRWIQIKPILPRPNSNGKIPTENQLAFLIGRKIYREGIKPTHALKDTIREFDLYNKIYNTIVDSIQQKIIEEIENEI